MKKWIIPALGLMFGALAGYIYWSYVGCVSGSCPITSSPVNSTMYGALLGVTTANLFSTSRK